MTVKNFPEQLAKGPQLGFHKMYPGSGVIERIGGQWDWVWIDGQHGQMDYSETLAIVRACDLVCRPAVVRVPSHEAGIIGRMLDMAVDGVMAPMVDTAEQARQLVQAAKFPPLGGRSFGGRRPIDLYGRGYSGKGHPQPILICQIETKTGLENASRIAQVEGVDAIFFGPDDMALAQGLPVDKPLPQGHFDAALAAVAEAAKAAGKIAGGVFPTPESLQKAVGLGYRLIAACGDVGLLAAGSAAQAKTLRECLQKQPAKTGQKGKPDSADLY